MKDDSSTVEQSSAKVIFFFRIEIRKNLSRSFLYFEPNYQTGDPQSSSSDNFAASLNDPDFLQDVLRNLPGVDIQSEAVRAALEQAQKANNNPEKKDEK